MALAGCEQLDHVPANTCGNRVVDANEECDGFPVHACHAPGTKNQCRIDCRKQPCAPGSACAADDVCRVPKGTFNWNRIGQAGLAFTLNTADITGDRRTDILMGALENLSTATFDQERHLTLSGDLQLSYFLLRTGELNGDGRQDVITVGGFDEEFTNSLRVLRAGQGGTLTALSSLTEAPPGDAWRLFAADNEGFGAVGPLLIVNAKVYRVQDRAFANPKDDLLADITEQADKLAGKPAVGNFDAGSSCDEIALAEEGANLVRVYSLCTASPASALLNTIKLPDSDGVGSEGLFTGELNGDTKPDLVFVTDSSRLLVSYGLGDGSFHSDPAVGSVTLGDNGASPLGEQIYGGRLHAVADLDQDGLSDFIVDGVVLLSSKEWICDEGSCWREPVFGWAGVATGDFNRDGIPDFFAAPSSRRALTFFMGVGQGKFNEFSIPTSGLPAPKIDESKALLAVGDYDGDLVSDLAFAESATAGGQATLTVLYGRAHSTPSEQLHVETFDDILALSGCQLFRHADKLTDVVMLGSCAKTQCIGRFSGQTNRLLFSPLGVPEKADKNSQLELVDAALGRFSAKKGAADKRHDLTMLARRVRYEDEMEKSAWFLYYVPSTEDGLDSGHPDPNPGEVNNVPDGAWPLLTVLDLDGDGIDEAVVHPQLLRDGQLTYWVARRKAMTFAITAIRVDAMGAPKKELDSPYNGDRAPRDINGDGREDLSVGLIEYPEDEESELEPHHEMIFLGNERGTLEPGMTFHLGYARDVAYLNLDDDPQLEMAVLYEFELRLYEFDLKTGKLTLVATYPKLEEGASLEAGDFDGNGVEDLATVGTDLNIFWGEALNP